MGECYYNAQSFNICGGKRLIYAEGMAIGHVPIPLEHAWCVLDDNIVIDLTWEIKMGSRKSDWLSNRVIGMIPEGWVYMGIPIKDRRIVSGFWYKYQYAGPILLSPEAKQ